jgi:hypothetical protein
MKDKHKNQRYGTRNAFFLVAATRRPAGHCKDKRGGGKVLDRDGFFKDAAL